MTIQLRFIYLYIALIALQIWAIAQRDLINRASSFEFFIRPLVLLSLWIFFWKSSQNTDKPKQRHYTLAALTLYWVGEIMLSTFDSVVGVALCHLVAHICYILAFSQDNPFKNVFKSNKRQVVIFWIGVTFLFSSFLLVELPIGLRLPTIAYLSVGSCWFLAAFNRIGFVPRASEQWVLAGVILFLCSNVMFAFNRFSEPLLLTSFIVFILVAVAHYCIVQGILKNH
jgi:YhhN family